MDNLASGEKGIHARHYVLNFILFLILLTLIGGFYILYTKNVSLMQQQSGSEMQLSTLSSDKLSYQKPKSNKKGYPVLIEPDKPKLLMYSFDTKLVQDTKKTSKWYGGASGYGRTDPLPSPNLLYTAYLDDKNNMWIISNDTLKTQQITTTNNVAYLSGWSPNSKTLMYYVALDTIFTRTQGFSSASNTEKFQKNLEAGFFTFDIDTGKKLQIYPVEYTEGFINNQLLLTKPDIYGNSKQLVTFDINTFEADYGKIKGEFGFGHLQYTFSKDGNTWAFLSSDDPTNDAKIIVADFPSKTGHIVEDAKWADVQFLLLSPDGNTLLYSKQDGFIEPGIPKYYIWSYDRESRSKKKYDVIGQAVAWIDEKRVVYRSTNASAQKDYLFILDLTSGESTKIY